MKPVRRADPVWQDPKLLEMLGRWIANAGQCGERAATLEGQNLFQALSTEPALLVAARNAFVTPALAGACPEATSDDDTATARALAAAEALNARRNELVLRELADVAALLNGLGITPLAIKGACHLATGLWPRAGARVVRDIDLLVPEADLLPAFQALARHAGKPHLDAGDADLLAIGKHCPPIKGRSWPVFVELHCRVLPRRFSHLLPAEELFERARTARAGDAAMLVPSPRDQALIAILHGPLGDGTYLAPNVHLRDVLDIVHLMRRHGSEIDWADIEEHLDQHGWSVLGALTNRLLARYAGKTGPFRKPPLAKRLHVKRWEWQQNRPWATRAGHLANTLAWAVEATRKGGGARRRVIEHLRSRATYTRALRRLVLGRST